MSSVLSRASLRYLRKHPAQLLLAVAGVAVGVAVAVGIASASASAKRAFELSARATAGAATHVVRGGANGVPESVFVSIATLPGGPPAAPVVQRSLALEEPARRTLDLLGLDPFSERDFRGASLGTDELAQQSTSIDGVVLSVATARELGVAAGDELVLLVGSERKTLRVSGTLRPHDPGLAAGLDDVALTDIATAQALLGTRGALGRIDLIVRDEEQLARIRALLPPECALEPAAARTESLAAMTRSFDLNLRAMSLLAMLVGLFLVYNTMTFSVVQRRPLWGMLRALGTTRGELFRLVCGEALAIGALGTLLGLGLGQLLARELVGLVTQTINDLYYSVSVREVQIERAVLVQGVVLGLGATLAGALWPALDAMRTVPRAVLDRSLPESRVRRNAGWFAAAGAALCLAAVPASCAPSASPVPGFAAMAALIFGAALLVPWATKHACRAAAPLFGALGGNSGRIAARGVSHHLARSSIAIAALATALAASAGTGILVHSFRGTVEDWLTGTLVADVYVSAPSTYSNRDTSVLAPELVDRVRNAPFVAGVTLYRDLELETDSGRVFATAFEPHERSRKVFRFLEGRAEDVWPAYDTRDALIVSESLARHRSLHVGSSLEVRTRDGEVPFEIVGVYRDFSSDQGWAMLSRATAERRLGAQGLSALALFLAPGVDPDAAVAEIRALLRSDEVARIRTGRTLIAASLEIFDRTFAVTKVLRLLAGVVAVLGVVGALLAIELEREVELGLLRALGLSPGNLRRIVLTQTGWMGALAGLFALPVGVGIALLLILVINARSFGWTMDVSVPPRVLLETFGLALASALIAGIVPALRLSLLSPARALRGE